MNYRFCRLFAIAICVFGCFGSVRPLAENAASLALRGGAAADQEQVLWSFCTKAECSDGEEPLAGLIMDKSDNLYGTTAGGGTGGGTVFELSPNAARTKWTETVLHSFGAEEGDGGAPWAGLIMDKSGNLYGTTRGGGVHGFGAVFELTRNAARTEWTETVLYSFCPKEVGFGVCIDGDQPVAGLIMGKSGNLYGTTRFGGAHLVPGEAYGAGTVFELTPNAAGKWTETVLHSFCAHEVGGFCIDGEQPYAGLIIDKSGHLYGTTFEGGAHGNGTVFELTPNAAKKWTETVLYSFCAKYVGGFCIDGQTPAAGLFMDGSGHLYGTTSHGGTRDGGTVFELAADAAQTEWTETVLHNFGVERGDGVGPEAGLIMSSGHLYGTTLGGGAHGVGTVFELTPDAATETVLHSFCVEPCADGYYPLAALIMDGSGHLYGTTSEGGAHGVGGTGGTVFELKP